jgi:inosose dehydratase
MPQFELSQCLVGANPIVWSNDDFGDLAGEVPLETILSEMRQAGFAGTELGHAYPRLPERLAPALAQHHLRLASGWHSTFLASKPFAEEAERFRRHASLLKTLGARVVIVAECTDCVHGDPARGLGFGKPPRPGLSSAGWRRLVSGLQRLAALAATEELTLGYHHHVGTVIQAEDDLERLLKEVPETGLLLDAGHLALAGIDPVRIARRHAGRIVHVHLKSVREEIARQVRAEEWSFYRAVKSGVFTVAGQGSVDYPALFNVLARADYRGWLIVEAEEDPVKVPALPKATRARAYVRRLTGA